MKKTYKGDSKMLFKIFNILSPMQTYIIIGMITAIVTFILIAIIHHYRKKRNDPKNYKAYVKKEKPAPTKPETPIKAKPAKELVNELEEDDPRYAILREYILTYEKVVSHKTWKYERFKLNDQTLIKFRLQGKTRRIYFDLKEEDLNNQTYNLVNEGHIQTHQDTPMMYRITGKHGLEQAKELIDFILRKQNLVQDKKALETQVQNETEILKELDQQEALEEIIQPEEALEVETKEVVEEPKQEEPVTKEVIEEPTTTEILEESKEEETLEPMLENQKPEGFSYNYSFTARLLQASEETKSNYSEIRSYLESYPDIKVSDSWGQQSFLYKGRTIAKIRIQGKTIRLYLHLDPTQYAGTKYNISDESSVKAHAQTPSLFKVKGSRGLLYSKDLLKDMFEKLEVKQNEYVLKDYGLAYEDHETLIEKGLIKVTEKVDFSKI